MPLSDSQLDQRLRDVRLPAAALERLHEIADPELAEVDGELADVRMPHGMLERVHAAALADWVEDSLRGVAPSASALARWRIIPDQRPRSAWRDSLLAASLLVVLSLAHWAAIGGMLMWARGPQDRPLEIVVVDQGPLRLSAPRQTAPVHLVRWEAPAPDPGAPETPGLEQIPFPLLATPRLAGPLAELNRLLTARMPLERNVFFAAEQFLGAPDSGDDLLPELERLRPLEPLGVEPPLAPGAYDRAFLLRERESPLLSPGHPRLRAADTPLTLQTRSFDRVRWLAEHGRFPLREEVRTEEVVAAMGYDYPPPSGPAVGLRTAAGPSPFSRSGAALLQIGVQARALPPGPPTHYTLLVDISASMRWGGRLACTGRAIALALDNLGPEDRLSLAVFNERAEVLAELAQRSDREAVCREWARQRGGGGTNLIAGLRRGLVTAADGSGFAARRLLVLTDAEDLGQGAARQVGDLLEAAQRNGVAVALVNLQATAVASTTVAQVFSAAGASVEFRSDADFAAWSLVESLRGRSGVVARDARMQVEFHPASVQYYRLVGHDPNALSGLNRSPLSADLRGGQAATSLFELWLKSDGPDRVANVVLRWRDPQSGRPQVLRQPISRRQFAQSFDESAICLQLAALAAETGEVLRGSYFAVNRTRSLRDVQAVMERVNPRLENHASFRDLQQFVDQLEAIRQRRGAPMR